MDMKMKRFIGTKIIHAIPALRITRGAGKYEYARVGEICPAGAKTEEGYCVRYADGYESWSPKVVFEESYRETEGLSFGLAIEAMKLGKRAARVGWNGKNQYIQLAQNISYATPSGEIINCSHEAIGNKAIAFVGTSGVQMGWLASQADMLAEDWMILD